MRIHLLSLAPLLWLGPISAQATDAFADQRRTYIVTVEDGLFPGRTDLLAEVRAGILAKQRQRAEVALSTLVVRARTSQASVALAVAAAGGEVRHHYFLIPALAAKIGPDRVAEIASLPGVVSVRPDKILRAHLKTATNALNHNADKIHSQGFRGAGATLAVLDSGIDLVSGTTGKAHPAFAIGTGSAHRIVKSVGVAKSGDAEDQNGHGSAVAAIAVARDWRSAIPQSDDGFAPEASIASYKITKDSSLDTSEATVIAAWHKVLMDRPALNIGVANLSFEGNPYPEKDDQKVLDQVAFYGDVLIVTSAGNEGTLTFPGVTSQANLNGISVGAIWADSGQNPSSAHKVANFSTFGPLPGDGQRFFPDIMAVGVGVASVEIDKPTSFVFTTGTSFSAPQVAGTALLIRAARPNFTFLDTKAVILNNVEELASLNPAKTRFHYGLGMLRSDFAVDALAASSLHRGGFTKGGNVIDRVTLNVTAGIDYAATLVWPRVDVSLEDEWDDLNLQVLDANGGLVAVSNSPRNLYERVLFTASQTGTYTLEITAKTVFGQVPYSLAYGINNGGGRQSGSYTLFGASCLGTAPDPAKALVLPPNAGGFGPERTRVPLSYHATRLHQAFDHAWFKKSVAVNSLAFRRDDQQAGSPSYDINLQISMGYTAKAPPDLDTEFKKNILGQLTKVVDNARLDLPGTQGLPATANQWDYVIPLATPFTVTTATNKNLLVEFRVYSHTFGRPFELWWDAIQSGTPALSRIYTDGFPDATHGNKDDLFLPISFVTAGTAPRAPKLMAAGLPQLAESFAVTLRHAPSLSSAILVHGTSRSDWGGTPLPFDLSAIGAPGCFGLTDHFMSLPASTSQAGQCQIDYMIPSTPSLTGTRFYNQFLILDRAANALGVTTTNGGSALVGG